MKIAFFDAHEFEKNAFNTSVHLKSHEITYFEMRLTESSAKLAAGFPAVCAFVNDNLSFKTLEILRKNGTELVALRSAGFNHVDLKAAKELNLKIVRVPEYSPHAVAEHALALILCLNRKIHRAYNRVREGNFVLNGLVGFDLYKKTVGVVGTGKIGSVMCKILIGLGCRILANDLHEDPELKQMGVSYVGLDELFRNSDIITLHAPLNRSTYYMVNEERLALTKPGLMLINTSRGALIDTQAMIKLLKSNHIGSAGLDVYEEEEGVFFEDKSAEILQDDRLARLLSFPNVLMTSHQGFLTHEALSNIAETTLNNITEFENQMPLSNEVF